MEKGWWVGIIVGLLVVFVIFMAGFYSGNVVTGQFFHKLWFGEQESPDFGEFEAGETEDLDVDEDSEQIQTQSSGSTLVTPVDVRFLAIKPVRQFTPRDFGVYAGKIISRGCNVITPNGTVVNGTGNYICQYYGYAYCSSINLAGQPIDCGFMLDCISAGALTQCRIDNRLAGVDMVTVTCCEV